MSMTNTDNTYEADIKRLEEINARLSSPGVGLQEPEQLCAEAKVLIVRCNGAVDLVISSPM